MAQLIHPYTSLNKDLKPLRGNLHAHTTNSDGTLEPQALVDLYASNGHDFLMISDHDVYTGPKEHALLDNRGMILIPGNEISHQGTHLLHVDADRLVPAYPDRQEIIDEINATHGFAIINHPNWKLEFNYCPVEFFDKWTGYVGLEIFNGVIGRLKGSPYATNKWDILLARGRRVWGYATDDFHREGDGPQGWSVVYAESPSREAIVSALRNGCFYASTGVEISNIAVDGMRITIETENADRIIALADSGQRLSVEDSNKITFEAPEEGYSYVRFECRGRGERIAWTQPFFIES